MGMVDSRPIQMLVTGELESWVLRVFVMLGGGLIGVILAVWVAIACGRFALMHICPYGQTGIFNVSPVPFMHCCQFPQGVKLPFTEIRRIDSSGRMGIPQEVMVALKVGKGDHLAWVIDEGGVHLKPVKIDI